MINVVGRGGTTPHILNPCTRQIWVVGFMAQPLYPKYQLNRRQGGPQRAGVNVLGRREMSLLYQKSNHDSFVILPTAQSLHSAIPAPSHITQHAAQQWVKEAPTFNKQKGSSESTNIAAGPFPKSQLSNQHHTSPTGLLPSILWTQVFLYTCELSHACYQPSQSQLPGVCKSETNW
jgi:hypothetical protein